MKQLHALAMILILGLLSAACGVTTKPLVKEDILKRIASDRLAMYKDQEPLTAPLTVEQCMARAIKYNLDHRLKLMEDALALRQVDLVTFDMLPRLVAAAGYTQRDTYNASSSMNVFTNQQSLAPSTSSDKGHFNADLTMTWNILDFGVSYFQAKQQADRAHIMTERRRKVVHSIMQQVRQAYWLALGAQQLEGRFEPLLKEVEQALRDASSIEQEKLRPPIETLTYRKTLLEIIKQLEVFRDELAQAKPRLASLMNLPLGQTFSLVSPKLETLELTDKLESLEQEALLLRPELKEADYNDRISVWETRKAIARMLPGVEMTIGGHYDGNSFLVNQQWMEGGARLTWNLMSLISGPSQYKVAKAQTDIAKQQRLALSMAVLTQVHVAYQDFASRKRQYELSDQLQDVDTRIHEQTMNQTTSGSQSRLNEIRSATAAMMAEYRSYQNYASLQNACGQIIATVGEDPLPETIGSHDINPLASEIAARLNGPAAHGGRVAASRAAAGKGETPVVVVATPTSSLSSIPESITQGAPVKLEWISKNTDKCALEPGVGNVQPNGSRAVEAAQTTVYTLTCSGAGGTTTSTATVSVTPAPAAPAPAAKTEPSPAPAVVSGGAEPMAAAEVTIVPPSLRVAAAMPVAVVYIPQASAAAERHAAVARLCSPSVLFIEFDSKSWEIKAAYHHELEKLADFFKEFPEATGEISGHTDNVGSLRANMRLSQNRAASIRAYLVNNFGIDPKRITAVGFGPTRPVADNKSAAGRQKNRRIETHFRCRQRTEVTPAVQDPQTATPPVLVPVEAAVVPATVAQDTRLEEALRHFRTDLTKLKRTAKLEKLAKRAETGDTKAMANIGWIYAKGQLLPEDAGQALTWYRLAAGKGNLEAQLALGWIYFEGKLAKSDLAESAVWYKKAAGQGSNKARAMLKKLEK